MIATTIEQSKRLLKAGVDPRTADMLYLWDEDAIMGVGVCEYNLELIPGTEQEYNTGSVPAWSLSALITLCPEHVPYRVIRTRGKDIEGIFEDLVEFLCKEK